MSAWTCLDLYKLDTLPSYDVTSTTQRREALSKIAKFSETGEFTRSDFTSVAPQPWHHQFLLLSFFLYLPKRKAKRMHRGGRPPVVAATTMSVGNMSVGHAYLAAPLAEPRRLFFLKFHQGGWALQASVVEDEDEDEEPRLL